MSYYWRHLQPDDPKFKTWKSENNLVMSWLINSMTLEMGENFLLYHSVKEIWDATKNTYLSRDNSAELFAVESLLHDQRQGDESVTTYFTTLTRHWQQLDLFEIHEWKPH